MLDIQWSSEGKDYCIQSSHLSFNGNASYTVQLENKTVELTIANLPVMKMSNFTIGPCVFSMINSLWRESIHLTRMEPGLYFM